MEAKSIPRIIALVAFTFFALFATTQIFSTGGNVLGNSFRYLTPVAIILGFCSPRFAFYLLLASGAYLDLIKRFMILDARFSDLDLAFLLGFAPALIAGIVLKFFMSMISGGTTQRETKIFWIITILCVAMGGAQVIMGGGLRNAGNALNTVAYLYFPLIIPRIFTSIPDLKRLMVVLVAIYLPAALWAIHQATYGIADFEMAYLLSGMTIEVRQLDEAVFRNMGTMVSAHALSMVASILMAALFIPVSWKDGRLSPTVWFNPIRWVCIILFAWGAYYTFSRTGWVCALVAITAFLFLRSKVLTYAGFFFAIASLTTLYLSASFLLDNQVMQTGQEWLYNNFGKTAEARQALVIGTLDARLESMSNFVNEKSLWTPFGLKVAGQEVEVKWVHDILSETIIKIGYIPLAIVVPGFLITVFLALRALFQMPHGAHRNLASYFSALTIGMLIAGFSQGAMVLMFPISMFWSLFFAMAFTVYHWQKAESAVSVPSVRSPVLNSDKAAENLPSQAKPRFS